MPVNSTKWPFHCSTMRQHISKEEIALRTGLSDEQIAKYTGSQPRTTRRICQHYEETGEIMRRPIVSSHPRVLNSLDATVGVLAYFSGTNTSVPWQLFSWLLQYPWLCLRSSILPRSLPPPPFFTRRTVVTKSMLPSWRATSASSATNTTPECRTYVELQSRQVDPGFQLC